MSIAEFSSALRNKADTSTAASASKLLDDFVKNASSAFSSGSISKKASVITENATAFRAAGEKQGRTRLVLTEDDFKQIFADFNISTSGISPMALYAKFLASKFPSALARHFEVYLRDGNIIEKQKRPISEVLGSIDVKDIIAIRGLNFSHRNTSLHIAQFIHYIQGMPGKTVSDIEKILLGEYDRGHVYAQTYGRAIVSLGSLANEDNILSQIVKLYELLDQGSSSLNNKKYGLLLARCKKDFTSNKLAMNIQFQAKRSIEGTGNRDTGDISAYIRVVGFLQSLIKGSKLSADGKRQLGIPAAVSLKEFANSLDDLNKKLNKYSKQVAAVVSKTGNPKFLQELKTSDSLDTYIGHVLKSTLEGDKQKPLKADTGNRSIIDSSLSGKKVSVPGVKIKPIVTTLKSNLVKLKAEISKNKRVIPPVNTGSKSIANLEAILRARINEQVAQNMGSGSDRRILNYRTGRLAESVDISRVSESRAGMISVFYNYMKNPYATFSDGGQQQSPKTRDPKTLISKSIREIAAPIVGNRLRSVLV